MLGGNDGDADVHVRQQTQIVVVDRTRDLAHVTSAAKFYGGGNGVDGAVPDAAGDCIPGDFDFLSFGEAADVRLVDESPDQHVRKIAFLQQEIPGLHVSSLLHGKRVDNAVEGGVHARFAQCIFGGVVGRLRFGALRLNSGGLGRRVAI